LERPISVHPFDDRRPAANKRFVHHLRRLWSRSRRARNDETVVLVRELLGERPGVRTQLFAADDAACEGDAMSKFAYELAQLGFSFVLSNSVSDDFEEDIENINYYMTNYRPPFEQDSDYKFPEIDPEFILSVRKFANIFEIRRAVQTATTTQVETAQFIWKIICQVIGQTWPEEPAVELGLTTTRRFQGAFGPLVQSLIVVALQTEGQAALVRIFELFAAGADKLEAGRKCGAWTGPEGARQFWTENGSVLLAQMEGLWLEFWEGIDRPAASAKMTS
jgi:hypothetical protein